MRPVDSLKAAGVALAVLVITVAASYPMVAFYAMVIEPGHPPEFYRDAALWIAPWSSHILGPLVFFALNFWLARRSPERNALLFAGATIVCYVVIDWSTLPMLGVPLAAALTPTVALSLCAKAAGALLGAWLGSRARGSVAQQTSA